MGTDFFAMEAPAWEHKDPDWFKKCKRRLGASLRTGRIALMVEELKALIDLLERKTGRTFEEEKLWPH